MSNEIAAAARSPGSRSGTLKIFVSSLTWTTDSGNGSEPPWRNYETAGRFNDASHGQGVYGPMRILLVSQMYPGPADPDLGVFVRGLEEQLVARGHEVERAVLDRRCLGKRKYLELARS